MIAISQTRRGQIQVAVEVQLLLASKKDLINLLENRFQLYQECISLIVSVIEMGARRKRKVDSPMNGIPSPWRVSMGS